MACYEWQKERLPLWQSFAFDDSGLNRLQDCQCSVRVNVSPQRVCYTSPAHLGEKGCDGDFLLRFQAGENSRRCSRFEDNYKFYDLASSAVLHFGYAQANLALYSTSAVSILIGGSLQHDNEYLPQLFSLPSAMPNCSYKVTRNRADVIFSTQAQVVEVERPL